MQVSKTRLLFYALFLVLPLLTIYFTWVAVGPQWDMIARYLNGRTLLNYLEGHVSPQLAFAGELSSNLVYYFEPYREPISTPIFAFLNLFFKNPILPFMVLSFIAYFVVVYKLGRELKADTLLAFAVLINPYTVYFLFMPNGGEGLAVIFASLGILYLLRKSPVSGLFFGLAFLSKYPAGVLFPLVLLLEEKEKIAKALALELLTFIGWGVVDWALYGTPFSSYFQSLSNAGTLASTYFVSPVAILEVVGYPVLLAAIAVAIIFIRKRSLNVKIDYRAKVLLGSSLLSFLGYIIIVPHNNAFTQARYGFLLSVSLLLCVLFLLSNLTEGKEGRRQRYFVCALSVMFLVGGLYIAYSARSVTNNKYYNPNNSNGIFGHVEDELQLIGFGNCSVVSNAWIPMIYAGYNSYSPFYVGLPTPDVNRSLAEEGSNYNLLVKEKEEYPIVVFDIPGVNPSFIPNLNGSRIAYSDKNVTIYLPRNATCYG